MADPRLNALIYSLQDSLMLLAPRGWSAVDLELLPQPDGLKLGKLEARGDGAAVPKERARFHLDLQQEARHLGDGLTELAGALGDRWASGTVRVERSGQSVDWKLLGAGGAVAWFTRLGRDELSALLVTDELLDLVSGTEKAFDDLQGQLASRLGVVSAFAFDTGTCELHLTRPKASPLAVRAQVLGAYLREAHTWVWSWADEEATPAATERVKAVCAPDAQQDGLSALWRPSFICDEGFAWTVAGSVAVSLGARGLFRGELPDGSGAALFAVLDLPLTAAP